MSNPLQIKYKRIDGVPWQVIEDQALVLQPQKKRAHELNQVGTFIWSRFSGELSGEDIVGEMVENFSVSRDQAERDYLEFTDYLEAGELISCP